MLNRLFAHIPRYYKRLAGSLNHALLYAMASILTGFENDFKLLLADTSVLTASSFWLSYWGYMFKVDRFPNELDNDYRNRIRRSLLIGGCTRHALLEAVRPYSKTVPIITEYSGGVTINDDYLDYITNPYVSIIKIEYTPASRQSIMDKLMVVDRSYLERDTYLYAVTGGEYSGDKVAFILSTIKMAGVTLILQRN